MLSTPGSMTKHGEDCRRAGLTFVSLVVETLGGWEEQAERKIKRLGAALARLKGQDEEETRHELFCLHRVMLYYS